MRRSGEVWERLRKNRPALGAAVILGIIALTAAGADLIAPYSRGIRQNSAARLQGPSWEHPCGTDAYGRDVLTRLIHGGRLSLAVALGAALSSLLAALVLGSLAAYFGGALDEIIMRTVDTILCVPGILLSLAVVAALGPGPGNMTLAIIIAYIPGFTRLIRSVVLTVRSSGYIEAARVLGTGELAILTRHILRNIWGPLIVQATTSIAGIILMEAGLSFIGLGAQPPAPEWGAMLSEAREFLRRAPHLMIFPGISIALSSLCFNLLGDGLRDALDPRFNI